jgi:putative oxidoreductase
MAGEGTSRRAMKFNFDKKMTRSYLALAFRVYIGALFIYASMYKISYTAEFAETIASYQLIPYWAINFSAITLPWIEMISGILLIAGFRIRSAALLLSFLLVLFTGALGVSMIRGVDIGCGCFHSLEEKISLLTIIRDLLWLGMTVYVFFYDRVFQLERSLFRVPKEIP